MDVNIITLRNSSAIYVLPELQPQRMPGPTSCPVRPVSGDHRGQSSTFCTSVVTEGYGG